MNGDKKTQLLIPSQLKVVPSRVSCVGFKDKLAECLCESAIKNFPGRRIRTDISDGDMDW